MVLFNSKAELLVCIVNDCIRKWVSNRKSFEWIHGTITVHLEGSCWWSG